MKADDDLHEYIRYICYDQLGDSGVMNSDMAGYMKILKLLGLSDAAKDASRKESYQSDEKQLDVYCYSTWKHLLGKPNVI